jgi:hypothetical protein
MILADSWPEAVEVTGMFVCIAAIVWAIAWSERK